MDSTLEWNGWASMNFIFQSVDDLIELDSHPAISSAMHWQEAVQLADAGNISEPTASIDGSSPHATTSSSSETESDSAEPK